MSRISQGSLGSMKINILRDLYETTEKRLRDRATKIAHDSRECWIAQYQPLLLHSLHTPGTIPILRTRDCAMAPIPHCETNG